MIKVDYTICLTCGKHVRFLEQLMIEHQDEMHGGIQE